MPESRARERAWAGQGSGGLDAPVVKVKAGAVEVGDVDVGAGFE